MRSRDRDISEFWVIGELQYTEIYDKLKRRNKLCLRGELNSNNLDDEADYSYLCGSINYAESLSI